MRVASTHHSGLRHCIRALVVVALATACLGTPQPPAAVDAGPETQTLTVALYPYVPRPDQFESALKAAWAQVEPGVSLSFIPASEWDGGYSDNPPQNADLFVFDAMFFGYFRAKGWLEALSPSEVQGLDDFVPYAIQGMLVDGQYYAIPLLGCSNILFYDASDTALANATKLSEIHSALSQCTYTSEVPPDVRGLMVDMAGGTTNAALYLDIAHSLNGTYPLPLPWDPSQIDPTAMASQRELLAMASYWNGTRSPTAPYGRASWFSEGYGRALIGFTESMSAMSAAKRSSIGFKVMPLSDQSQRPLFYADVIGVNTSTVTRGTRDLAVKLANVLAASDTVVASLGPQGSSPAQYLMATRPSAFHTLGAQDPIYQKMYALVTADDPLLFTVSDQSRDWLTAMKDTIRSDARSDYTCGCDYTSSQPIFDNADAQTKCPPVCAAHGGWNGQWTNQPPAPGSVCGCKACPSPSALPAAADPTPRPHY